MSRTIYDTLAKVDAWLRLQVDPVYWAVAPDNGQPRHDAWKPVTDASALPRGKKLLLRPKGKEGKGGVHVLLVDQPVQHTTALTVVDPVCESLRDEYRRKLAELERDRAEFNDYREAIYAKYEDTRQLVDRRVHGLAERYEKWEERLDSESDRFTEMTRTVNEALKAAHEANERNEIAVSVVYAADKISNLAVLSRIRRMEDVPQAIVDKFEKYLAYEAQCRFLAHLPLSEQVWAKDFMKFSGESRNAILQAVTAAMREEAQQNREKAASRPQS